MTSLSYILRVLWLTNPTRSNTPAAAEAIIEAVEALEEDLREARAEMSRNCGCCMKIGCCGHGRRGGRGPKELTAIYQ